MSAGTLAGRTAPAVPPAALLAQVWARQYRWPADFPGFAATVLVHTERTVHVGALAVRGPRELSLRIEGPDPLESWATGQLATLVEGRWAATTEHAAGLEISVDEHDAPNHPLGYLLTVPDIARTRYRIRDGRITEVVRQLPDEVIRVAALASTGTPDGRELPAAEVVSYTDPLTGALRAVETVETSWTRVAGVLLPVHRRVVRQDANGCTGRDLEVIDHVAWR